MPIQPITDKTSLPPVPAPPDTAPLWLTPFLWDLLKRPMRWHPLYKHHARPNWSLPETEMDDIYRVARWGLVGIILLIYGLFPLEAFVGTVLLLMLVPFLWIVFTSTVAGTQWAMEVSAAIAVEQRRGRYTLMSLTPRGGLGIRWIIGVAHMHRGNRLPRTHQLTRALAIATLIALTLLFLLMTPVWIGTDVRPHIVDAGIHLLRILLPITTLALIIWIDTQQSAVLSCLIGMLVPSVVREPMQVRLLSAGLFLLVQLGSYIVTAGLGWALYVIVTAFLGDTVLALSLTLLGIIGMFVLLREIAVRAVWQTALWHFNTHTGEFYRMARI